MARASRALSPSWFFLIAGRVTSGGADDGRNHQGGILAGVQSRLGHPPPARPRGQTRPFGNVMGDPMGDQ